MTAAADGRSIASDQAGGSAAGLTLVAVGTAPRLRFAAPTLETPAGHAGSATASIRYTSTSGVSQGWTTAGTLTAAGALLDSFSVHGKVDATAGFANGRYNVQTVVTCEQ